ncbi:DUF4247 domain-containing protein [Virgibacillus dakarensis]|uniref:DUF4247 domain-containing protein n=1 Tax=Virgibacillus dakarensis TaxID=1917889 RepID=UPI000B42F46D|nr:DUF4247 domain-containing protein [Virgibacillus dakarensis]MBT2216580.1 DUF4247 domain-containing protein [Virgibacillus dakarensis]
MRKKLSVFVGLLLIMLIATSCSSPFQEFSNRGMSEEEVTITTDDIPEEPDKQELISKIKGNTSEQIDDVIEANFSLMDVVSGEGNQHAEIYATKRFALSELATVLIDAMEPEKASEVKDNQQIFIYPDHFVTLKESEEDDNVLLIEVAEDEFVRRNYSPSFLGTYFTFRLLDSLFGNNWSNRRAETCRAGDCYGGYTGKGYYPDGKPKRGNTTFRGGGPGAGK